MVLCRRSVLLTLLQKLKPGLAGGRHLIRTPSKSPMKAQFMRLEQCNEVVKLARALDLSLVGLAGEDIASGNKKFVLGEALCLQPAVAARH